MYEVIDVNNSKSLGYIEDEPVYIVYRANLKCFTNAKEKDFENPEMGIGIAFNSVAYNIFGKKKMKEDIGTVELKEIDPGVYLMKTSQELQSNINRINDLENIICDLDNEISTLRK